MWWLSTDPSKQVVGTVTWDGDAWQLELVGTLSRGEPGNDNALRLMPPATVFGVCKGRRLSLIPAYYSGGSSPDGPCLREDITDAQFAETWTGYGLIEGAHVTDETRYTAANCQIAGLDALWSDTGLKRFKGAFSSYRSPAGLDVEVGDGVSVRIYATSSSTTGVRVRSIEEVVRFSVRAEQGLTYQQITEDILTPMKMLMAINFNRDADYANLSMLPAAGEPDQWVAVDPDVRSAAAPETPSALLPRYAVFDAKRVDVGALLAGWLELARVAPIPMAVAAPHGRRAMLQDEVVGAVNAAETLHRIRHSDDVVVESAFAVKVKDALPQLTGRLNYEQRRQVASAVAKDEIEMTLEKRLTQLADDLGAGFCEWFFGGYMADWAFVSATLRNALSHGYETRHKLEKDTSALIAVNQVTRAVVQISLLTAAGLPTDAALVKLLSSNDHFGAVKNQTVLDWATAAKTINPPAGPAAAPAG